MDGFTRQAADEGIPVWRVDQAFAGRVVGFEASLGRVEPVVELLLERRDLQPQEQHLIFDVALSLAPVDALFVSRNGGAAVWAGRVPGLWIPGKHFTA